MEQELDSGVGPDEIAFTSFTNAACNEARSRAIDRFSFARSDFPYFRTEHSICFRLLGLRRDQVFTGEWIKKFSQEHPFFKFSGSHSATEDRIEEVSIDEIGDQCEFFTSFMMNTMLLFDDAFREFKRRNPFCDLTRSLVVDYLEKRNEFKVRENLWDFSDMLYGVLERGLVPPVKVLVADECFPYGVDVRMADGGLIPIGEIVEREIKGCVKSFNHETGKIENRRIVGWHKVPLREPIITINNLLCTANHPVFTKEFGYITVQRCLDLRSAHILKYKHENIRKQGNNPAAKESYMWEPIRRCEYRQAAGKSGQFQGEFRAQYKANRLFNMEVRDVEGVGSYPSTRLKRYEPRRPCSYFYNHKPPSFHGNLQLAVYRWQEANHMGIPEQFRGLGVGCLVPRRWVLCERPIELPHRIIQYRELQYSYRMVSLNGNREPLKTCKCLTEPRLVGCECDEDGCQDGFGKENQAIYSAFNEIQDWGQAIHCSNNHSFGYTCREILQDMREYIPAIQVQGCLLRGMLATIDERYTKTTTQTQPRTKNQEDMCYLRQRILDETPKEQIMFTQVSHLVGIRENSRANRNSEDLSYMRQCFLFSAQPLEAEDMLVSMRGKTKRPKAFNSLPRLWQDISKAWDQTEILFPIMRSINKKEKHEGYVYCLDVEDNHNFFANDILVHNCQDLSPLQYSLIEMWAKECERVYIAADPLQALYSFSGASPDLFFEFDAEMETLRHSYRLTAEVKEYAKRIIEAQGLPFPEFSTVSQRGSIAKKAFAAIDWENVTNAFVLGRTKWQLAKFRDELMIRGIPFVIERGPQNPLQTSKGRAFRCMASLSEGGHATSQELKALAKHSGMPWIVRGGKSKIGKLEDGSYTLRMLSGIFSDQTLACLKENFAAPLKIPPEESGYLQRVYRKKGMQGLDNPWGLVLTTLHGSKGRERDNVFVSPDLTTRVFESYLTNRTPEALVYYVGVTRTIKELTILVPEGKYMYPMP